MFFSKNKGPKVTDTVFLSETGYSNGLRKWLSETKDGMVIMWFQKDMDHIRSLLTDIPADRFVLSDRASFFTSSRPILFGGHYPIRTTEMELCNEAGIDEMKVYMHLDMPILKH